MEERVSISVSDGIADVRLVRADKMNALDAAMFEALVAASGRLATEKGVRAVVLSGEGRAFCAGLDMDRFAAMKEKGGNGIAGGEARDLSKRTHGLADRHAVEDELELAAGRPVVVAMKPDRGLPDAFDQVEHVGPFLITDGVAEDAPEQADIVPQPGILLKRLCIFVAIG